MPTKKILSYSVVVSLIIHLVLLSLIGFSEWRNKKQPEHEKTMTLNLKEILASADKKPLSSEAQPDKARPAIPPTKPPQASAAAKPREATVDLNSQESRYRPYLAVVRKKIEDSWIYPEKASTQKQEGTTVIRFSLANTGQLVETAIIQSSGTPLLDEATLVAVKTPSYNPLPEAFQLSRLNVVATFEYRLIQ